jgi:drug/metabolite transporter (DMT)-like permease
MKPSDQPEPRAATARLMLVVLSLAWGLCWPAMKVALDEIPPISMRVGTTFISVTVLFLLAKLRGQDLRVPAGAPRVHVIVAATLNIIGFTLLAAFAQMQATTSRVTILAYTMPIWAALLARPILGELITPARGLALALCVGGLAVLIYPLAGAGNMIGVFLALGAAISWALGTVYQKWARIPIDPLSLTCWQFLVGFLALVICLPIFEGSPHLRPVSGAALFSVVFTGMAAALAYLLWFTVVKRLPAMTASLGVLSAPVIGVVASAVVLGERPTIADIVGFALILAAASCVLLQPQAPRAVRAEPELT